MKLYHGTKFRNIKKFELDRGRGNLDFGKGVYFTTKLEQAIEWSCKHSVEGAVYECEINLEDYDGILFTPEDDDLYYVLYLCRIDLEEIVPEILENAEKIDYIQGVMLDGRIKNFEEIAEKFNEGDVTFEELKAKTDFFDEKDQTCIKSAKGIDEINSNIKKIYLTKKIDNKIIIEDELDV